MSTPDLYLQTAYVSNDAGRLVATREPGATIGPLFVLVRGVAGRAWAIHADLPPALARRLDDLAAAERPAPVADTAPAGAGAYRALLDAYLQPAAAQSFSGPAFTFPADLPDPGAVVAVSDERQLAGRFSGWTAGEIGAGRAPVMAVVSDGAPAAICFCARRSLLAAEAGVVTAPAYRGRGLAPRAVAAWARAVRATGRTPLYSTDWRNAASLAVARKLRLSPYATIWSLSAPG